MTGAQKQATFRGLLKAQKNRCIFCRAAMKRWRPGQPRSPRDATIDHFVPLSRGGPDEADNLRACCRKCNTDKGNKMPDEFLASIRRKDAC